MKAIQTCELSSKESSAKNKGKNFKSEMNSDLKFDYKNSHLIKLLRQRPFLSLYSYLTSRRIFTLWRSRTSTDLSDSSISSYIRSLRDIRIAGVTSSFLFGLLALAIIIPLYNVSGTEDTEAASSYVPSTSSITFTSTRNKASINLTPTSTTGTFVQSDTTNTSEVASFDVTTDNATGYTLGIASSTDTTSLTNGTDTLPTITNASTGITASTFNTSTYNDMWGYLPSKYNSTSNTGSSAKFYPMTTTTATLDETTAANSTANTYTIALGARVTMSKSSGTYTTPTGTAFILTAVGKPASYSITYNQNTTDTVSDLPEATGVQSTSAQSITLSSAIPTRTNYNFLGWCSASTSDLTSGTNASSACTSVNGTYYAGGTTNTTFYIDETTPNVTTLYAMWELAGYTITFATSNATGIVFNGTTYTNGQSVTIPQGTYSIYGAYATKYAWQSWSATAGTFGNQSYQNTTYTVTGPATITLTGQSVTLAMQNLSSSNCTTTARPVYDTRDNSVYWVQKLADDRCWMLDNLALDLTSSTIVNNLSTSNTNLDTTALSYFKNGGGSTSDRYPTAAYTNWTSSYSYSRPMIHARSKDIVLVSMDAPTTPNHKQGAYGLGQNKVGAYYNYCAASVGYYCYGNGTSAGTSSGDNSYDVCPTGWRMPTSGSSGEYNALYTNSAIGSDAANLRNALSTPLSGYAYSGSAYNQGSNGYFWSSTRRDSYGMYRLSVNSSTVYPTTNGDRNNGLSVRCVLKVPTLYETVASMSKGNFDMSTINTSLTTANSGVYKYTGSHSDNGTSDIYFYRGIIDSSFTNSSAGSSGDGTFYPNYVKLTTTVSGTTYNTCWRIFRTTASGGVKMIYNGLWTGSTCANATTSAQLSSTTYYNRGNTYTPMDAYYTKGFIVYVGYNYNTNYAYNNTGNTTAIPNDTLFTNGTASNIRTAVENWYTSTLGTATNSLLESNAGYCNDRSTYDDSDIETTNTIPYAPSSTQPYFGARYRNYVKTSPSLACPYPSRDLLTTSNGLGYPVALITIDEAVLAGNGYSDKEAYAVTSYLASGSAFWSLSPSGRGSMGSTTTVIVTGFSYANNFGVGNTYGVRPVISLKFGTTPASGSGTATDPWVVQ